MKTLTLESPAKLNLCLDILGKRPDGFHELSTLFERIDLNDTITLKKTLNGKIRVFCKHPHVPKGPKNLVVKIAKRLQADLQVKAGVDIYIDKRIPVAAGLAGGSSNGATVLMGLNRLWQLELSQKELNAYAASVGSDLNFFLYNTSYAIGTGRGEQIRPLNVKTKLWHVLVTPKVKMLTRDVFASLASRQGRLGASKLSLTNKKDNVSILLPFLREGRLAQIAGALSNDLEPAILSLRPDFALIKKKLSDAGALGVCFSGSGPSVYALALSRKHANTIREAFDRRYAQVFVTSTM